MTKERTKKDEHNIKSIEELIKKLKAAGIPVDTWDQFKGLNDLWEEIKAGETSLIQRENLLLRQVRVARIFIFYVGKDGKKYKLIEDKQIKSDGTVRKRTFGFVAEKFKVNESPLQAARRGVEEELGIEVAEGQVITPREVETERKQSPSYPGLESEYQTHYFEIQLTDEQFNPDGYVEDDGKKKTYFKWVEAS